MEPCVQGEDKPQEEQDDNAENKDVDPSKAQTTDGSKPPEPLQQGDPGTPSAGKDTTAPQQRQQELGRKLSKMPKMHQLEMKEEAPLRLQLIRVEIELKYHQPSLKSQQQTRRRLHQGPERRLQKLDILREADGGDDAMGQQQEAGAEQGLHLADPKSGLEALGETKENAGVDQKAMGITEQDGEAEEENEAMAMDEEQPGKQEQKLPSMHLQDSRDRHRCRLQNWQTIQKSMPLDWHFEETKEGELPDDQGRLPSAENDHGAVRRRTTEAMEVDAEGEAEDEVVWKKRSEHEAMQLWGELERSTSPLAAALCEQLRTILEPTLKGRLQGYFRTGKRISMRRVIPFIASNYRRDKIWLRRTKPSKREYQAWLLREYRA
eukprot:g23690.t1